MIPADLDPNSFSAFTRSFNMKFGYTPGMAAAFAYDAMDLALQAIHKGGTDHEPLTNVIKSMEFNGITGHIEFDELSNRTSACKVVYLKDGELGMK